ncbi:OsmC family protein [uncultured Devosia sp.]|uniref:OsmC family protein n=1 Tax=uncultured Devosia sp. TaxID=211434 RepID=UPI0035CBFFF7
MPNIVARPTTVDATLDHAGQGSVQARSGAAARLANLASDEGFTPLEFMDAALAGCLVLSVRIAARKLGMLDRLVKVDVSVTHEKAAEPPSRVASFTTAFMIEGEFSREERQALIAEAHAICTVGNTFKHGASISDVEPALAG